MAATAYLMKTARQLFRTYLEVEYNASPHTVRNYLSDLNQFAQFAMAHHPSEIGRASLGKEC